MRPFSPRGPLRFLPGPLLLRVAGRLPWLRWPLLIAALAPIARSFLPRIGRLWLLWRGRRQARAGKSRRR